MVGSFAARATTCVRTFACCAASAGGGGGGVAVGVAVGLGAVVGVAAGAPLAGALLTDAVLTTLAAATQAGVPVRPRAAQVAASTTPVRGSLNRRWAATTAARVCGPNARSGVRRNAFCKTPTAGPMAPVDSVAQVTATPLPAVRSPHAAIATGAGSARQVAASIAPVALTL